MDNVFFIVLRRMRQPLLTLIITYTVTILGLILIPGQEVDGEVMRMSIFHAFYFVSYMATTIGFGEIPYEFSDAQRIWVTLAIYATVVVWIYAIGTLLTLIRDSAFQQAVTELRFAKKIRRLREPFYLICGYGETGTDLVKALTEHNQHAVVIDHDPERISMLELESLRDYVPSFCADVRRPSYLQEAGLTNPMCEGVVALTNVNETNLKVAITSKLLNPDITVICRADSHDIENNMESFGTDHIIDPFDTFGTLLSTALQAPGLYLLHQWLTGVSNEPLKEPIYPPREGTWIICGFGRFGKAIYHRLSQEGIDITVIELDPEVTGCPAERVIEGRGTEADTLIQAGIKDAAGLVAGTDNDANNLSIVVTALELNPELFTIARQNEKENQVLFDELAGNMVMNPSGIIANKIRVLLATPMLYEFVHLVYFQDDGWACELISRISGVVSNRVPDIWELDIDDEDAHAVCNVLESGGQVLLGDILKNRFRPDRVLNCIPLLLESPSGKVLLPEPDIRLKPGDRILFCADQGIRRQMEWGLLNERVLAYLLSDPV